MYPSQSNLILLAALLCSLLCCGDNSPNSGSPETSSTEQVGTDSGWFKYRSAEAGFEIDALFEPELPDLELKVERYAFVALWQVANPNYMIFIRVQEMPVFITYEDSQKRAITSSINVMLEEMNALLVPIEWVHINGRLFGRVTTHNQETSKPLILLAGMAYKANYILVATGAVEPEAEAEVDRIISSFQLLDQPPTAIANAREVEEGLFYVEDGAIHGFDQLLALGEDPNRGLTYDGLYHHPELSETQETRLRRIMLALDTSYPLPWETWVFNVRYPNWPIEETLAIWARVAIAWETLGQDSYTPEQTEQFIQLAYSFARLGEQNRLDVDDASPLDQEAVDRIQQIVQQIDVDALENWFSRE